MRKIIHCDCDCFYAAVEMRDDPSLRGLPVAIGGASDRRGVIATCNYEARSYGVRSAMPTATALRLCPQLLLIPPNADKYRAAAQQIRGIFQRYSDAIEPLSLDEAYLDVTDSPHCRGSATLIAEAIRTDVAREVGISVSAGVAPNKFLAKIASDWRKPNGLFVIAPDEVAEFVAELPVAKIHGVGPATARKLTALGIDTCADLRDWELLELGRHFGRFGQRLHDFARGIDERAVQSLSERKSLSVEHTFPKDLPSGDACVKQLPILEEKLLARLQRLSRRGAIAGQFVKLKCHDFRSTTVDRQHSGPVDRALFGELMREAWQRFGQPVRLLGVGLRFHSGAMVSGQQLSLFDAAV